MPPRGGGGRAARRRMLMELVDANSSTLSVVDSCHALGVSRATYYRWRSPKYGPHPARKSPRALSADEKQRVLSTLRSQRFCDQAPAQVVAALLDEGTYLCSERTMYRLLEANGEVRERRAQLRHPSYQRPELLATGPRQLWSWDITKLPGPAKWTHFHLYVILDVFSRYVVGWMVAERESSVLAEQLISQTCERQGIVPGTLTLHADRGSSMRSKPVALLLSDLGVTKTHSRPYTSDDNPYSEAQFKTLKYRPGFPQRFGSVEHARQWAAELVRWYNTEHHHSALGLMTPQAMHDGHAPELRQKRQQVLLKAFAATPQRFVAGVPIPPKLPTQVWINEPKEVAR
jgi:putative transposase